MEPRQRSSTSGRYLSAWGAGTLGEDLWFDLTPRFETTRSALGIHRCYPGTGCICIPDRTHIDALAAWVREAGIRQLTVVN